MSVFGINVCKFTGTGSPDSTTRTLYYSTLIRMEKQKRSQLFESPVSASRDRTLKTADGSHYLFVVRVQLHLYDTDPDSYSVASAKAFANTLLSYENKLVVFYPFKDGAASGDGLGKTLKDSANGTVNCYLYDLDFDFLFKESSLKDYVDLYFETQKLIDISKTLQT